MARFSGRQGKGKSRILREIRREEAEARNDRTLPERRKSARKAVK